MSEEQPGQEEGAGMTCKCGYVDWACKCQVAHNNPPISWPGDRQLQTERQAWEKERALLLAIAEAAKDHYCVSIAKWEKCDTCDAIAAYEKWKGEK